MISYAIGRGGKFILDLIVQGLTFFKINPNIAPKSERSTWGARMRSLPEVFWIIIVFILVVGGIMRGYFTPTEAGAVGARSSSSGRLKA
jgi:TRAP-type C4-dicarboxylate transport system permease large subunit